jgi:hypothetical protein
MECRRLECDQSLDGSRGDAHLESLVNDGVMVSNHYQRAHAPSSGGTGAHWNPADP